MDSERMILLMSRARSAALPVLLLLAGWTVYALAADPYTPRVQPPRPRGNVQPGLQYSARLPLSDYLEVVGARELFKPSVLYETKKTEVVNVLGDLSFLGVVRNGDTVQALLMNKKTSLSSFYVPGQMVEDLEIEEIHDTKIIFRHGEETLELIR